jgi:hypothetical protein
MRFLAIGTTACALLLAGGARAEACELWFAEARVCASLTWLQEPTSHAFGSFELRFWDENGSASGPYVRPSSDVAVKLWMPSMGHGSSPVTVKMAKGGQGQVIPGVYVASRVAFSMAGEWEIWVALKDGAVVEDKAKTDYAY